MKFPEQFRLKNSGGYYDSAEGDPFGFFLIPARAAGQGRPLKAMATDGFDTGWEHVSVTLNDTSARIPNWLEMCAVKDLFWDAEETVVQFHPPKSEYVNEHPGCLHLWRNKNEKQPRPPKELIGWQP